jgi:putative ABC transport system substrate-binding protein
MRLIGLAVVLSLVLAPLAAEAQQAGKVYRIGWLASSFQPPGESPTLQAFRQALREAGYVEGENLRIEYRFAEEKAERLPGLARDLVRLKVDLIVANSTISAQAAKRETATIPIVVALSADPVLAGLVASLARPGGNVTGMSAMAPEAATKRLGLLKEAVPRLARVAVLSHPDYSATHRAQLDEIQAAAPALRLRVQLLSVRGPEELESAFAAIARERAAGLVFLNVPTTADHRRRLADLALRDRLPTVFEERSFADAGGLMAYGPSFSEIFRRAAGHVARILQGAKPADLPVEQPTKLDLVINLKTAKALGLTIPQTLLLQADQVIQ